MHAFCSCHIGGLSRQEERNGGKFVPSHSLERLPSLAFFETHRLQFGKPFLLLLGKLIHHDSLMGIVFLVVVFLSDDGTVAEQTTTQHYNNAAFSGRTFPILK
jgi:hypothetical protein